MSDTKDDFLMALMNVPSGCWVIPGWDVHRVMRALQEATPAAPAPITRDEARALLIERAQKAKWPGDPAPAAPAPAPDTKDAERYRWLRERYAELTRMECAVGLGLALRQVYVNTPEKFDAAIDAAIAASKGGADA